MQVSDYTYKLPEERIAQHPPKVRGTTRLLALNKETGTVEHRRYGDMIDYLSAGDVVVLNDTKVIKARLIAKNGKGQARELLLLEDHHNMDFTRRKAIYRGKIRDGEELDVNGAKVTVEKVLDGGMAEISSSHNILEVAEHDGSVPLPPYMHRAATPEDTQRYQTVFAREPGSVAAPTASLNFTDELEEKLRSKGIIIAYLTLHVGLGTFLPIRSDNVEEHTMHSEYFEVPAETIKIIQNAKLNSNKIVAVGTTVTRTLEYLAPSLLAQIAKTGAIGLSSGLDLSLSNGLSRTNSTVKGVTEEKIRDLDQEARLSRSSASALTWLPDGSCSGECKVFIYPGYKFKLVDTMLTNFHAPKSTVLMMAAAFAGWDNLLRAYEEAIEQNYAFLSYGDSMLIV